MGRVGDDGDIRHSRDSRGVWFGFHNPDEQLSRYHSGMIVYLCAQRVGMAGVLYLACEGNARHQDETGQTAYPHLSRDPDEAIPLVIQAEGGGDTGLPLRQSGYPINDGSSVRLHTLLPSLAHADLILTCTNGEMEPGVAPSSSVLAHWGSYRIGYCVLHTASYSTRSSLYRSQCFTIRKQGPSLVGGELSLIGPYGPLGCTTDVTGWTRRVRSTGSLSNTSMPIMQVLSDSGEPPATTWRLLPRMALHTCIEHLPGFCRVTPGNESQSLVPETDGAGRWTCATGEQDENGDDARIRCYRDPVKCAQSCGVSPHSPPSGKPGLA